MRKPKATAYLFALLIAASCSANAQDQTAAIQQKLSSEFTLTQPNGAMDDIVTAGSVIVLKKGPLVMTPVTSANPCQNAYNNGKISQNGLCKADKGMKWLKTVPGMGSKTPGSGLDTRTFVPGEKMWMTKIDVQPTFIDIGLFTDGYGDAHTRYKADLKLQFPKGWSPTVDQADKLVNDVFGVAGADNAGAQQPAQQAQPTQTAKAAPAAAQEAPPPPIAPPPPPPADPKTVSLKEAKEQVVADFGQPTKIINLGTKEIYVYKDMKVTFVAGKVADVQ